MSKIVIGADTETQDELLKTAGYSWKYGKGKILCTALYYEAEDKVEVIPGLYNENNNLSEALLNEPASATPRMYFICCNVMNRPFSLSFLSAGSPHPT